MNHSEFKAFCNLMLRLVKLNDLEGLEEVLTKVTNDAETKPPAKVKATETKPRTK